MEATRSRVYSLAPCFGTTPQGRIAAEAIDGYATTRAEAQGMTGPRASDRVFSRVEGRPREQWCVESHIAKVMVGATIDKPPVWHDRRHALESRLTPVPVVAGNEVG